MQRKRTRGELAPSHGFAERWLSAETVRVTPRALLRVIGSPPHSGEEVALVEAVGRQSVTRIMAFRYPLGASECVRGRLPLLKALRDELGPRFLAAAVQHLEV